MTKIKVGAKWNPKTKEMESIIKDAEPGDVIGKWWDESSGYWREAKEGQDYGGAELVLNYDPDAKEEPKKSPIKDQPETWFYGLSKSTISDVDQVCEDLIRSSYQFIRKQAEALVDIKSMVPEGNWLAFCGSSALPFSARTIQDLVAAWTWLKDTEVEEEVLGRMSPRTMAKLGVLKSKVKDVPLFDKIEKDYLLEGIPISENQLKVEENKFHGKLAPKQKEQKQSYDDLKHDRDRAVERRDFYKQQWEQTEELTHELAEEVQNLKAQIREFEEQALKDGYESLLSLDSYRKIKKTMGDMEQVELFA